MGAVMSSADKKPTYKNTDYLAVYRSVERKKEPYVVYQFSGRKFVKKD